MSCIYIICDMLKLNYLHYFYMLIFTYNDIYVFVVAFDGRNIELNLAKQ